MPCQVLLVDDNEDMLFLAGAFLDTDADGDIELVGLARTGREAIGLVRARRPHVILLDLLLETENGLDIAEQVLHIAPETAIVLFSEFLDGPTLRRAELLGIAECVPKDHFQRLAAVVRAHCPAA